MPHDVCRSDRQSFALFTSGYDCPLDCYQSRPWFNRVASENPIEVKEALVEEIVNQRVKSPTADVLDQLAEKIATFDQSSRSSRLLDDLAKGGRQQLERPKERFSILLIRGKDRHGSFCAWKYGDSSRDENRKFTLDSTVETASAVPELSPGF